MSDITISKEHYDQLLEVVKAASYCNDVLFEDGLLRGNSYPHALLSSALAKLEEV